MIGTGYVGLVSGACFADFGHHVTCVDKDAGKIAALQRGEMPIYEPGLDELVAAQRRRRGRLIFTTDLHGAGGARPTRCSSRSARRRGAATAMPTCPTSTPRRDEIAAALDGFTVVVTKSTVPVGTGDEVERIIREARAGRRVRRGLQPGIPARGRGDPATSSIPTASWSAPRTRAPREVMTRALPAALSQPRADPVHRPAHRRADQIRRQRLPRDQDHLHQRDRRSVREGRRRRAGGGARHRPRQPHRRQVPACRARAMAARAFPRTRWR